MVEAAAAYAEVKRLLTQSGISEASFEAEQLFEHLAGRHHLLAAPLSPAAYEALLALAARRIKREPLQYILGTWDFLGLRLHVGPGVLIPRPETEEVCLAAAACLEESASALSPHILDLCAGSGALALGLQKLFPKADILAAEKYDAAFAYLARNCGAFAKNHPATPRPVKADILVYHSKLPENEYDLILSNPPYITENEYPTLAPELSYEPKEALVAPENGLFFYRQIARHYKSRLKPNGTLVFEIGGAQGAAVLQILQAEGYAQRQVLPDMQGLPRIALARRAESAVGKSTRSVEICRPV